MPRLECRLLTSPRRTSRLARTGRAATRTIATTWPRRRSRSSSSPRNSLSLHNLLCREHTSEAHVGCASLGDRHKSYQLLHASGVLELVCLVFLILSNFC